MSSMYVVLGTLSADVCSRVPVRVCLVGSRHFFCLHGREQNEPHFSIFPQAASFGGEEWVHVSLY